MKSALGVISFILLVIIGAGLYYYSTYTKLQNFSKEITQASNRINKDIDTKISIISKMAKIIEKQIKQMDNDTTSTQDNSTIKYIQDTINMAKKADSLEKKVKTNEKIEISISKMLEIVEKYPQIKANDEFTDLLGKLDNMEKTLKQDTEKYNKIVSSFNKNIEPFPTNIIAKKMGLKKMPLISKNKKKTISNIKNKK